MAFTVDDLKNIQGLGVAGFKKDHSRLVFITAPDGAGVRNLVEAMSPLVASAWEVASFNELFSEVRQRQGRESVKATWAGLALSSSAFAKLGVALDRELPPGEGTHAFMAGMAARAEVIGDTRPSDAPAGWLPAFRPTEERIDAVIVLAGDDPDDLSRLLTQVTDIVSQAGAEVVHEEQGGSLPGGKEHFGFRDGGSQPAIAGYGPDPVVGEPGPVAAGEFVLGYADEAGQTAVAGDLIRDGSFFVYRRLRQHVQDFRQMIAGGVAGADPALAGDNLGAKLVGRWPSGAPLELNPAGDPGDGHESNAFSYGGDPDGLTVPRFAHIRKANPRDEAQPTPEDAQRHRMIRRGTPYGAPLAPDAQQDDGVDRGLHFISIVADVARQFEFVQSRWLNDPNFPNGSQPGPSGGYGAPAPGTPADGPDPIVGEHDPGAPDSVHQPSGIHAFPLMSELVTMTGGEYFFMPSLLALARLAAGATTSTAAPAPDPQTPPSPPPTPGAGTS